MAHTNSTTNYNLPQFLPTDKPAWLVDVNPAYAAIDTAIKNVSDAAGAAQTDATQALSDAAGANAIATQANSKAEGAIASLSEQFLDTATYTVGEYVIFNNILYVCTEPVTTPGPWTGSVNWARASLDNIATELRDDIHNMSIFNLYDVTGTPQAGDHMEWSDNNGTLEYSPVSPNLNVLTGSWIAESSNAYHTDLTNSIILSKGLYLVIAAYPEFDTPQVFLSDIEGTNINKTGGRYFNMGSYQNGVRLVKVNNDNTPIKLLSKTSTSTTFSYTERGGLYAYKLA